MSRDEGRVLGFIGAGPVGRTLATAFARAGQTVLVAHARLRANDDSPASANYVGPFVIALLREASAIWQSSARTRPQRWRRSPRCCEARWPQPAIAVWPVEWVDVWREARADSLSGAQ